MKTESNIKPTKLYDYFEDEPRNFVVFNDLSSIKEVKKEYEDKTETVYVYNSYQIKTLASKEYVDKNASELYELAKQDEYNLVASQVRERRRKLLEETDCECLADRTPSQEMIDYRQALRDIPEQEGFPYDVVFPKKPC